MRNLKLLLEETGLVCSGWRLQHTDIGFLSSEHHVAFQSGSYCQKHMIK